MSLDPLPPRHPLLARITTAAGEDCHLAPDLPLVVGVSGGPDSLCLAHALLRLKYPLIVAHFDHHLRPESGTDAQKVQNWSQENKLRYFLGEGDIRSLARSEHLSIEEAARVARYRFLFSLAHQQRAQAVAVAHNADDQVETILMHLLRGAGLSGLRGMQPRSQNEGWDASIPLVRPLLGVWRQEIEAYCLSENLSPVQDPTNNDLSYFRNRLRHRLLPYLEEYNPQVRSVLWRTGRALAGDAGLIESLVASAWETCLLEAGRGYYCLDWENLGAHPVGLQRGLLRKAVAGLRPGLRDLDFEVIEKGVRFLSQPTGSGSLELSLGLALFLEPPYLYLAEGKGALPIRPEWPQIDGAADLSIPGQVDLGRGWVLQAELGGSPVTSLPGQADPWQACLDYSSLVHPLRVAAPQPGQRFQPLGMHGQSQKLSDFFVNEKVPRRARIKWPLVLSGETVVWIPGLRPAEHFRTTPLTPKTIRLRAFNM